MLTSNNLTKKDLLIKIEEWQNELELGYTHTVWAHIQFVRKEMQEIVAKQ